MVVVGNLVFRIRILLVDMMIWWRCWRGIRKNIWKKKLHIFRPIWINSCIGKWKWWPIRKLGKIELKKKRLIILPKPKVTVNTPINPKPKPSFKLHPAGN